MPSLTTDPQKPESSVRLQNSLYKLWHNRVSGRALRLTFLLLAILVLLVAIFYWRLPPEIPLTYSRPWGIAQLVPSLFLFLLVGGLTSLVFANLIFAAKMLESEQLLAQIVVWINTLTVLLIVVTVVRVILLVI